MDIELLGLDMNNLICKSVLKEHEYNVSNRMLQVNATTVRYQFAQIWSRTRVLSATKTLLLQQVPLVIHLNCVEVFTVFTQQFSYIINQINERKRSLKFWVKITLILLANLTAF